MSPTLPFVHALKTPRKMRDAPPAQHKTMPNVPRPRHVALSFTRFVIGVGVWSHGQTCPYDSLNFPSHVIHLRPSTNDLDTSYDVLCTFTATEPKTCLSTFASLNKGRVYCLERYIECTKAARACHACMARASRYVWLRVRSLQLAGCQLRFTPSRPRRR